MIGEAGKQTAVHLAITGAGNNAMLYLPPDYNTSGKNYPLIIFCHGIGESDVNSQVRQGLPKVIAGGNPPYAMVNGERIDFIVAAIVPIYFVGDASNAIKDLKSQLRVDASHVYITGLSLGARTAADYISCQDVDNLEKVAAAVPMSYTLTVNELNSGLWMKNWESWKGRGLWAFTGETDTHTDVATEMVRHVNEVGGDAKLTIYPGGHNGWPTYYGSEYREDGKNIYEWMMQFSTDQQSVPPVQDPAQPVEPQQPVKLIAPRAIIKDGDFQKSSINITADNIVLDGSPTTGDVEKWYWSKVSGPACKYTQDKDKLTITDMQEGTYVFSLNVKNSRVGHPSTDKVTVNVRKGDTKAIQSVCVYYNDSSTQIFNDVKNITVTTTKDERVDL